MSRVDYEKILADFDPYEVACAVETYVLGLDARSAAHILKEASRGLPGYYRSAIASALVPQAGHLPAHIDAPTFEQIVADAQSGDDIREPMIAYLKSNLRAIPLMGRAFAENVVHVVRGEEPRRKVTWHLRLSPLAVAVLALAGFIVTTLGIRFVEGRQVAQVAPARVTTLPSAVIAVARPALPIRARAATAQHPPAFHARPRESVPQKVRPIRKYAAVTTPVRVHSTALARKPLQHHTTSLARSERSRKKTVVTRVAVAPVPQQQRKRAIETTNPIEYYAVEQKTDPRHKRGVGPFFSRLFGYIFGNRHER
jgi:hypothetical protein